MQQARISGKFWKESTLFLTQLSWSLRGGKGRIQWEKDVYGLAASRKLRVRCGCSGLQGMDKDQAEGKARLDARQEASRPEVVTWKGIP